MRTSTLIVHVDDGTFNAHVALPSAERAPAVLLIQEIFGVNADMRAVARSYADRGYLAVVPDLFWRFSPGIELDPELDADCTTALDLYGKFDQNVAVGDLQATLATVRDLPSCSGKAGCAGFCLGGMLAYLMATRSDSDASVGYYGVGIEHALAEASSIANPLLLHIAEADAYVPPAAQSLIRKTLAGNRLATVYSYPGCEHAFGRVGSAHYDKGAAELADGRTADFLQRHLASG
jgi:carboxymethylenebutenolidase